MAACVFVIQHHRAPSTGPHITKDKPVSHEDFVAMVSDRLLAVQQDRDAMRRRVQDRARKQGRTYEEIMVSLILYSLIKGLICFFSEGG